ncbi:MAG: IclR family transcriptional regulator [Lachnospiraceae bacterium]|nr:IclR family transcriptional regulator [Lachnospiraceae bacterium]
MKDEMVVVPAVMRTLNIIEALFLSSEPKSLNELSKELEIPTASLFRIMKNLVSRDYVTVLEGSPLRYTIGHRPFWLVTGYRNRRDRKDIVKPVMQELTARTNQTAQYAVFQNGQFMYTEQVLSAAELNVLAQLYMPLEVNTSAGAKVILANQSEEIREQYLSGITLHRRTGRTIDDMDALRKELILTKKRGYGMDNEEFTSGIGCMAVPVFDGEGQCGAALGVTGYIEEYRNPENFEYIKRCLFEAAREIREKLN